MLFNWTVMSQPESFYKLVAGQAKESQMMQMLQNKESTDKWLRAQALVKN